MRSADTARMARRRRSSRRAVEWPVLIAIVAVFSVLDLVNPAGLTSAAAAEEPGATDTLVWHLDLRRLEPQHTVSPMLFGTNLSYFNDLDDAWRDHDVAGKLRAAGVGALRYPGGEETSRFHWEHPGVNGYVDLWNEQTHRWTWQSTWVPPEQWGSNEAFMNFDEFIAAARAVGAEPLVGINMSSGVKLDRVEDSIAEAVRWVEYAREKGYGVRYWYLDNEPWHEKTYQHMPPREYGELCARFAEAMSAVDPDAKFIANPVNGSHSSHWPALGPFLEVAGEHVDVLDFHWYWEFGTVTWDRYLESTPLKDSSRWHPYERAITYTQRISRARQMLESRGYGHIGVAALEWNVGPWPHGAPPEPRQLAMIHAEMLLQFVQGGLDMACVWPLFYQIRNVEHESSHRSWLGYAPPHEPRPAIEVVRLLSASGGGRLLVGPGVGIDGDMPVVAVRAEDGANLVYALSKRSAPTELVIQSDPGMATANAEIETFSIESGIQPARALRADDQGMLRVAVRPLELLRIRLPDAPDAEPAP